MAGAGELIKSLKAAIEFCRELESRRRPDVYLMSTSVYRVIRDEMQLSKYDGVPCDVSAMCGVQVEHYLTVRELHLRAIQLRLRGLSVALVTE